MPSETEARIKIQRLPPGPDRDELHYSGHCFDSGLRAKHEIRYGSNPDVLVKHAVKDGTIAPRIATAVERGEEWVRFATPARLKRLPEHYRLALELFYWRGLSHREAASALGKSESALWCVVFRAKRRLEEIGTREDLLSRSRTSSGSLLTGIDRG